MSVQEFIVSEKPMGQWVINLKGQNGDMAIIDFKDSGARQEFKDILDANPDKYDHSSSTTRLDFTKDNKIICTEGLNKYIFSVNSGLYKKIKDYLSTLPIGGVYEGRYAYSSTTYGNHLKPIHLDSDIPAAAAAIGESLGGPNIGSRMRSFLSPNKVTAKNLEPWRIALSATRRRNNTSFAPVAPVAPVAPGKRSARENNKNTNNINLENKYKPRSRMAKGGKTRRNRKY